MLAVARVAGILAAKRTPELVPLCHPVRTTRAAVELELDAARRRGPRAGNGRGRRSHGRRDGGDGGGERRVADGLRHDQERRPVGDHRGRATRGEERRQERGRHAAARSDRERTSGSRCAPRPLSVDEAIARVKHAGAGAVCVFLGTVRDHNEGRAVVKLEYEAYSAMAVAEMKRIVEELERRCRRRAPRGLPPYRGALGGRPRGRLRGERAAPRRGLPAHAARSSIG